MIKVYIKQYKKCVSKGLNNNNDQKYLIIFIHIHAIRIINLMIDSGPTLNERGAVRIEDAG